jgi:glycosyltransferase involved in cell wall biosynthesis
MDLVSIIIPAFNEEKNIGRLLESIVNQSYSYIEIIVVDDESSDRTAEISKKLKAKVYTREHMERSAQRNFGAEKSKGKYLVFLDADMELEKNVIKDLVETSIKENYKLLVIPERTVGNNYLSKIRAFEREMYMGDLSIEVARFFERKIFFEYKGYDLELTGPEDYDLPYRISKKNKIGRGHNYILHHEENVRLSRLLKRKYYYAKEGAKYAKKHPELIVTQGNLLFRRAYFKNWKKFLFNPILGVSFIFVRILESFSVLFGYISAYL